jgi:cell division protein FtsA
VVVEETIFEPFAASHAVLDGREREMGIAVADMGSGSIELVGYLENSLELAESIPIGGDHFVNDVATLMRLQARDRRRSGCRLRVRRAFAGSA